jgi:prepilin-type N-terminal cleavage/methylation domain-containing protein
MKRSLRSPHARSGFTLIELLVVIAIIAILAGATIAGVTSAINAAKRAKAGNTATQIQTAVMAYDTEYGLYPVPAGTEASSGDYYYPSTGDNGDWSNLIISLSGDINPLTGANNQNPTITNSRQIAFMTPKRSDLDTQNVGVLINPMTSSTATPISTFNLIVDSDYSGVAGDTGTGKGKMPNFSTWGSNSTPVFLPNGVTQGAAVWACCDTTKGVLPSAETTSKNPNLWVHTY